MVASSDGQENNKPLPFSIISSNFPQHQHYHQQHFWLFWYWHLSRSAHSRKYTTKYLKILTPATPSLSPPHSLIALQHPQHPQRHHHHSALRRMSHQPSAWTTNRYGSRPGQSTNPQQRHHWNAIQDSLHPVYPRPRSNIQLDYHGDIAPAPGLKDNADIFFGPVGEGGLSMVCMFVFFLSPCPHVPCLCPCPCLLVLYLSSSHSFFILFFYQSLMLPPFLKTEQRRPLHPSPPPRLPPRRSLRRLHARPSPFIRRHLRATPLTALESRRRR